MVTERHLDALVHNGVRGYAFIPFLKVLPSDLIGVGAQGVSDELGEPSARFDVGRAQPRDEVPQLGSLMLDNLPVGIIGVVVVVNRSFGHGKSSQGGFGINKLMRLSGVRRVGRAADVDQVCIHAIMTK